MPHATLNPNIPTATPYPTLPPLTKGLGVTATDIKDLLEPFGFGFDHQKDVILSSDYSDKMAFALYPPYDDLKEIVVVFAIDAPPEYMVVLTSFMWVITDFHEGGVDWAFDKFIEGETTVERIIEDLRIIATVDRNAAMVHFTFKPAPPGHRG